MKIMDAKEYLWDLTTPKFYGDWLKPKFDYICIDLWDGLKVCPFVFDVEFVVRLKEVATGLVSMNIKAEDIDKATVYSEYGFKFDRSVALENNLILWWSVIEK